MSVISEPQPTGAVSDLGGHANDTNSIQGHDVLRLPVPKICHTIAETAELLQSISKPQETVIELPFNMFPMEAFTRDDFLDSLKHAPDGGTRRWDFILAQCAFNDTPITVFSRSETTETPIDLDKQIFGFHGTGFKEAMNQLIHGLYVLPGRQVFSLTPGKEFGAEFTLVYKLSPLRLNVNLNTNWAALRMIDENLGAHMPMELQEELNLNQLYILKPGEKAIGGGVDIFQAMYIADRAGVLAYVSRDTIDVDRTLEINKSRAKRGNKIVFERLLQILSDYNESESISALKLLNQEVT